MEEAAQIAHLLNNTLSPDGDVVRSATDALDRLSLLPHFPFSLLSIATGGENQGQRVAAATYLKNFTRRNLEGGGGSKEFKDHLMRALLRADPPVLKLLVEAFRVIVVIEFVQQNSWPELIPQLKFVIQSSDLINTSANCDCKTVNALTLLHTLLRPFQYFLNPKVAKEPVPAQLELVSKEILAPMLAVFHHLTVKVLSTQGRTEPETEKILLILCKCMYYSVRSHMPTALVPVLPSFCSDLIGLLGSLNFNFGINVEDGYLLRLKTGKRSFFIFRALVTRHRKYSDKLMPDIVNCALKIVKYSTNICRLDFLSERVISLAFDVISHVLETGPGWRIVSPYFSFLLESAIFPALVLNEKDISEWEEDADEYIRKNLPSELEEVSGWREDLFTVRKSALNLIGVISMLKGPPLGTSSNASSASSKRKKGERNNRNNQRGSMGELLVLPFLSKFPIPTDANQSQPRILNDYFGVLMAYGGLQDFLKDQKPGFITVLVRNRVLPLYTISVCPPYLVASANWVLGELACCLPDGMNADVYSSLLKAMAMPDMGDASYYPVRVSAAGAIAELLENDYLPPEWLPLLQVVISRVNMEDEETSTIFQLLTSVVEAGDENVAIHIPYMVSSLVEALSEFVHSSPVPWPQLIKVSDEVSTLCILTDTPAHVGSFFNGMILDTVCKKKVLEKGFTALAVMAQSWESFMPEKIEQIKSNEKWTYGRATIGKALSSLLQQAWLVPMHTVEFDKTQEGEVSPSPSCIDDSSTLLRSIMLSVSGSNAIEQLKLSELLSIWANLIADWHAWEESEDLSVFDCIKEVVGLHSKYGLKNFLVRDMPSPPAPPVPQMSIIEGIGAFISEAISQYPSATWRACSCVHMLLHTTSYSSENESVKQSLAIAFSQAAFSRFKEIQSKPSSLWKPLLLVISSCYLCYPDIVVGILEKEGPQGFTTWASALAFTCTGSLEPGLQEKSELKLAVLTLSKVIEQLLEQENLGGSLVKDCFNSLMEASVRMKEDEMGEGEEDSIEAEDSDESEDDDDNDDDDENSEEGEYEETEEEFLERYAKAAVALHDGTVVEEGDVEDQDHEIDLGSLEEVDEQSMVVLLIEKFHHVLIQEQSLPSETISSFLTSFPKCRLFFQR